MHCWKQRLRRLILRAVVKAFFVGRATRSNKRLVVICCLGFVFFVTTLLTLDFVASMMDTGAPAPLAVRPVVTRPSTPPPVLHLKDNPTEAEPGQVATDGFGQRFVWVPRGGLRMGSPADEEGRFDDEGPVHHVHVTSGFWLGQYEVTQAQWESVMEYNPSRFKGSRRPVEMVTWEECQEFCHRLSVIENATYRLPTAAEWEYACKGRTTKPRYGSLVEIAWCSLNSDGQTHEVGGKLANAWGLHDLLGNVSEWCVDRWHENYCGAPRTASPWVAGDTMLRVIRGGCWNDEPRACRAAHRTWSAQIDRFHELGLRLVREGGDLGNVDHTD